MTELNGVEKKVLEIVHEFWPISALEIAEHFKEMVSSREEKKRASSKYTYYLKKLVEKRKIFSKRVGNALIVWPVDAEKYRTIHQILMEDKE